ncbi:MAG: tol-pal system protein YbgF [Succinivibrionaceae bacterium]|jgi:tol-pal system protein YbgF|nr:tol-pal system protein YbgF [Succinivibrionaceae bacterium]
MNFRLKYLGIVLFGLTLPSMAGATSVADLERQIRASDQARLQMQQQLDLMNQDLNDLIGRLEVTNNAINDLQKNQQELFQQISDLTARINQLQSGGVKPASGQNSTGRDTGAKPDVREDKPKPSSPSTLTPNEKNDYQKAVTLVMQDKNYNAAIDAFNEFNKKYPDSSLISNANFWLGDSYYKTNRLTESKQCFLNVVKDENAVKRAEALYKLGLISVTENNKDYARKFFQLVVRDYSGTTTARLAENELKKLK